MDRDVFSGKSVVVMGLGRFGGGLDAAQFAADCGARVIVTDLVPREKLGKSIAQLNEHIGQGRIELHLGCHERDDFERADVVIANPAVPFDNEFLAIAEAGGALVTSQIEIFFQLCPAAIVGITGANGKSTTTSLTAHLLRGGLEFGGVGYKKVWLGGNIGNEPLLTIVDQIAADDAVVLELSSFQVEQLARGNQAPQIALLTNLTPNHLDRYGTFEKYCASKEHMFALQDTSGECEAVSLFNGDDPVAVAWFEKYCGQAGRICAKFGADDVSNDIIDSYRLPGRVNVANLAAALAIVRRFGVCDEAVKGCLGEFRALGHRLEFVEEVEGVRWYNDSKATTPLSAIVALDAFCEPTIIIAGGYDKNLPFDELGARIASGAKGAVLIGEAADKIAASIAAGKIASIAASEGAASIAAGEAAGSIAAGKIAASTAAGGGGSVEVRMAGSLAEAVEMAGRMSEAGDVVVLSPACASFDMFENFEKRGDEFCRLVQERKA